MIQEVFIFKFIDVLKGRTKTYFSKLEGDDFIKIFIRIKLNYYLYLERHTERG